MQKEIVQISDIQQGVVVKHCQMSGIICVLTVGASIVRWRGFIVHGRRAT